MKIIREDLYVEDNNTDFTEKDYMPTTAEINKLIDRMNRGSKENVKTMSDAKALRYYYAACLIGWSALCEAIWDEKYWDLSKHLEKIEKLAEEDPRKEQYADSDTRTQDVKLLQELFPQIAKALADAGINYTFSKRKPTRFEMERDTKNGKCWTLAYTLEANGKTIYIANHTNEGGGTYGYSVDEHYYPSKSEVTRILLQRVL